MASITWAMVVNHAPQLSTVDTDAQVDILAYVNSQLNVRVFGGEESAQLKLARIYLAAHFGTGLANGSGGEAGPVVSESAGGLSRSYGSLFSLDNSLLASTAYGQAYLQIVRSQADARIPGICPSSGFGGWPW